MLAFRLRYYFKPFVLSTSCGCARLTDTDKWLKKNNNKNNRLKTLNEFNKKKNSNNYHKMSLVINRLFNSNLLLALNYFFAIKSAFTIK